MRVFTPVRWAEGPKRRARGQGISCSQKGLQQVDAICGLSFAMALPAHSRARSHARPFPESHFGAWRASTMWRSGAQRSRHAAGPHPGACFCGVGIHPCPAYAAACRIPLRRDSFDTSRSILAAGCFAIPPWSLRQTRLHPGGRVITKCKEALRAGKTRRQTGSSPSFVSFTDECGRHRTAPCQRIAHACLLARLW